MADVNVQPVQGNEPPAYVTGDQFERPAPAPKAAPSAADVDAMADPGARPVARAAGPVAGPGGLPPPTGKNIGVGAQAAPAPVAPAAAAALTMDPAEVAPAAEPPPPQPASPPAQQGEQKKFDWLGTLGCTLGAAAPLLIFLPIVGFCWPIAIGLAVCLALGLLFSLFVLPQLKNELGGRLKKPSAQNPESAPAEA